MTLPPEKSKRNSMEQQKPNSGQLVSYGSKEESKLEDEISLSDGGDTFLNNRSLTTHFNFENVCFTPKVIEFIDAFEGKQFTVKLKIQNVGTHPVLVKVGEPNSFIFQMKKPSRRTKFLAAGASITKSLSYTFHNVDLVQKSQIPVQINGHLVDYPIVVRKAVPEIEIQPQKLDFRTINLGASAKMMVLTILNKGGKRTKFKIDVGKNVLDLVVSPMRGTIKAKSKVNVLVEVMGFNEGDYYHELWIKTNEMPIRVPVLVKVVRPRLEIVYPNGTEDFTLITFKPTFNGTQKIQSFVLYNCSIDTTLFSTLAEVNGELQVLQNARSSTEAFSMFLLTAEEGRLEPFESRIISVLYRPKTMVTKKSWQHKQNEKKKLQWEHIVFLRINRVHRIERKDLDAKTPQKRLPRKLSPLGSLTSVSKLGDMSKTNSTSSAFDFSSEIEEESTGKRSNYFTENTIPEEKVLRLCLYGNAVEPDFLFQPNSFEFGDLILGETKNRVLRITNNSTLPVKCRLCKQLNVKTKPEEIWLKMKTAHEFDISVTPTCAGIFESKLKVEILAQSDVVFVTDKKMETVATYTVTLKYKAKDIYKAPSPKLGLGIGDDARLRKALITFKDASKCPPVAVLDLRRGFKTKWMEKEADKLNNVDNALIALPNDRPRLFYTWPKDKACRAIFTGFFRYSPPEDLDYTLSSQEAKDRKEHKNIWTNYLAFLRVLRGINYPDPEELGLGLEYNVSCKDHYKMTHIRSSPDKRKEVCRNRKWFTENEDEPDSTFVPLSPLLLSKVIVQPKFMNFDKVAVGTVTQKAVSILNMNLFPISIKFVSGKTAVSVMEQDTITIQPSATKYIQISFHSKDLGRYFGFLNYVINGSHEFKITISAFVTAKTLFLGDCPVTLNFGMNDPREAFQPRSLFLPMENLLQSPIKYRWQISQESAFVVDITEGEIPPKSKLLAEILFDMCPGKSFYSEFTLISESGIMETVKLVHPSKKVPVSFLSSRVDMQDIPLNLLTKTKAIVQNASYHDVTFEVVDATPLPGITIQPKQGLLKARSFFPLEIRVQIPVIMSFSFQAVLMVHFVNKISVKVTGRVVLPLIRIKPSEVVMRKICAQSMDLFAVCVENVGTTPAEVAVNFKNCPEYKIADKNSKIYLPPKQSSKFLIQIEPMDVARYMFYLPVTVNNILGPPEMQEPETEYVRFYISKFESLYEHLGEVFNTENSALKIPCVCLNSTVTQNLLSISTLKVNFKLENKLHLQFHPQNIVFSNESDSDVTFCIRNDDLGESNNSPFNLVPQSPNSVEKRLKSFKAELTPGKQLVMKATFEPKKPGFYNADVPIFVKGYSNGLVYNYIRLKGELKPARINPEVSEVHFPPLPLDVDYDVKILICAENYRTRETINCIIYDPREENGEPGNQCLKTNWLTEPNIVACSKPSSFYLRISFQSSVPVALKNYIVLFDSSGVCSTIFVTAIADNSSLTTHAFLSTRSNKYRIVRDKPTVNFKEGDPIPPSSKSELKIVESKNLKDRQSGSRIIGVSQGNSERSITSNACSLQIDKGPRLIIHESKSINRPNQLGFVNLSRHLVECGTISSYAIGGIKAKVFSTLTNKSESMSSSRTAVSSFLFKRPEITSDVSYPNFPNQESAYKKHFERTLNYVERWMFEVVMQCDQYLMIPQSFQCLSEPIKPGKGAKKERVSEVRTEKDFLSFLQEVTGKKFNFSKNFYSAGDITLVKAEERPNKMRLMFAEILRFLESKGCLLPHVKPEYLMEYEDYIQYISESKNIEYFSWKKAEPEKMNSLKVIQDVLVKGKPEKEPTLKKSVSAFSSKDSWKKTLFDDYIQSSDIELEEKNPESTEALGLRQKAEPLREASVVGKQFFHEFEILDQINFRLRCTQAWLDIVTQVFRVFWLKNVTYKKTIPHVSMIGVNDKIPVQTVIGRKQGKKLDGGLIYPEGKSYSSNVFTIQERLLMDWLNRHIKLQYKILWNWNYNGETSSSPKLISNFDKDLSDSVAFIAITASHCPYIVPHFFTDVFAKPDTPNKVHHNAAQLILAWRSLEIGLTVETTDIIQPNPVFMVMLVTHLYDVLPSLHPHSTIFFTSPLNSDTARIVPLKNDFQDRIVLKAKFYGEHSGFFSLGSSTCIDLKPLRTTDVKVVFSAHKIKKASATLLLSGCCVSPNFAKHMVFYLEGEPSELPEQNKFTFTAPLYKVICTSVPVRPPLPASENYEVWYTTRRPVYTELTDIGAKPWSKIWRRKISRRLFLNKTDVTILEGVDARLNVTVACLTEQVRLFWLLFRSKICDFIVLIEINPQLTVSHVSLTSFYPDSWSSSAVCTCSNKKKLLNPNSSSCPFLTEINIPMRNEILWNALWTMFSKSLQPHEKTFWKEHFEMDIGICLILWLLSSDEEEEVVDEFIQVLSTRVTYNLNVEPPNNEYVLIPPTVEILDVRKKSHISVPIHVSKSAPSNLVLKLTMTSENGKEIRNLEVNVTPPGKTDEGKPERGKVRVNISNMRTIVSPKEKLLHRRCSRPFLRRMSANGFEMNVDDLKRAGKASLDCLANYHETLRQRPVLPSVDPGYLQDLLPKEAPKNPEKWEDILNDLERVIIPGLTHWQSPKFHAYFPTACSCPGIMGELISAGLGILGFNWVSSPACTELEVIVLDWLGKMIGIPKAFLHSSQGPGGGAIQGSASESTFVCLLAAKKRMLNKVLEEHPDWDEAVIKGKMVAYSSEQSNSSVEKAGILGSMRMRLLETDERGSLRGETLLKAVKEDIANGLIPTYVCATLGTTVTCAFDVLDEIGPICNSYNVWLHIDAAYAAAAFVCPEYRHLMSGAEYADSFNFNAHKWLLVNFDCSALWVKDASWLVDAFKVDRVYLKHKKQGVACAPDYRDWQIPLGRRFRSLKLWFTLRYFGQKGLQQYIRSQIRLAREFENLVKADSRFELAMESSMALVCFRLKGPDDLTRHLHERLMTRGNIYVLAASFRDIFFIRFVVCSASTQMDDIMYSWNEIREQASEVLCEFENKIL